MEETLLIKQISEAKTWPPLSSEKELVFQVRFDILDIERMNKCRRLGEKKLHETE